MVDASALVGFVLGEPPVVDLIEDAVTDKEHEPMCAPDLIHLETLNALRRYLSRGLVGQQRATEAAQDLARTRLATYPHAPLAARVWEFRHNLSAYDASYLALAEILEGSILVTADRGLAATASDLLGRDQVQLVS